MPTEAGAVLHSVPTEGHKTAEGQGFTCWRCVFKTKRKRSQSSLPYCLHPQFNPLFLISFPSFPLHSLQASIPQTSKQPRDLRKLALGAGSRVPVVALAQRSHTNVYTTVSSSRAPQHHIGRLGPPHPSFAAPPSHQPGDSKAYLKHVVSSPEAFRHGYLVVVILFSEQTSLRKRGKVVGSPRGSVGQCARGDPRPGAQGRL